MEFRRCPQDGSWQLSLWGALGLTTLIIVLVVLSVGTSVVHLIGLSSSERLVQPNTQLLLVNYSVRCATVLIASLGVASYILVGSKAPRPRQLHVYGLTQVLGLIFNAGTTVVEVTHRAGRILEGSAGYGLMVAVWAVYRAIFYKLMIHKLMALGPPASRCQDVHLWGNAMIASIIACAVFGVAGWGIAVMLLLQGVPPDDVLAASTNSRRPAEDSGVSLEVWLVWTGCINVIGMSICGYVVTATAFLWSARRLMGRVVAALTYRGTAENLLSKVRSTLQCHFLGLVLSLSTTVAQMLLHTADGTNILAHEEVEDVSLAVVSLVDCLGDVAGILLLSGIGTLLWREDPDAGDVNKQIRNLLHSAVLTGRADLTFEGEVAVTPSRRCIASFPGKYLEEWRALTWLCERQELSSACVFLPLSDPQKREHSACSTTPGECWCYQLYGAKKEWGCRWFEAWQSNIKKAISLDLDLVVVFFPGEAGQGVVDWNDLAARGDTLWDGCGLGGSQKGEVAFLRENGIKFIAEDLGTMQSWLSS